MTSEKQRQEKRDIKKADNSKEKEQEERTVVKMGPSTSSKIRLRGKYVEEAPDEIQHMSLLQNKLPLTKAKKKYYGLPVTTTFEFHYESGKQLLENYLEYMQKFQDRKKKSLVKKTSQYILDIKDVWHSVDKSMCLFPNALKEHEMVESCFFLPLKKKLLENKDRNVEEQQCHIQAETITSKLGSVVRFLKFIKDRSIFAGFRRGELGATKQFLSELKSSLKNLLTERTTKIREHKSKIYLQPQFFKNYGSSEYVKEIHTFLEALTTAPQEISKCHIHQELHNFNFVLYKCPQGVNCNTYYTKRSFVSSERQTY